MAQTITIFPDLSQIVDSREAYKDQVITANTIGPDDYPFRCALLHFGFPDELKYKRITTVKLALYMSYSVATVSRLYLHALAEPFSSSVTWATKPDLLSPASSIIYGGSQETYLSKYFTVPSDLDRRALANGLEIRPGPGLMIGVGIIENSPYMEITYEDDEPTPGISLNPSGGYVSRLNEAEFSWTVFSPDNIYGEISQISAEFCWKAQDSASFAAVSVGNANSYTVPAGTFPAGSILWFPQIELDNGQTISRESSPASISTVEPLMAAEPVSPINTIEDGSREISFAFSVSSSVGSSPTGADLQYSLDGSRWLSLDTVSGSATTFTAPANTFTAGTVYWRVRVYNTDGAAGAWSSAASFVCIAAPAAPSVMADSAPFTTIRWQSTGQQAYRVTVDGVDYGIQFGTGKRFTLPEPLQDGQHTATVEIQGVYSLWSAAGSVSFTVQNEALGAVQLNGSFGIDATLQWSLTGLWELGGLSSASSSATANSARLRTPAGGIPADVQSLRALDGYDFVLYCYNGSTYLGQWNGSGFVKSATDWTTSLDLAPVREAGATILRIVMRHRNGGTLTIDDGKNIVYDLGGSATYLVYRDGRRIGGTGETIYSDMLSLGEHRYVVLYKADDGYYIRSNEVIGFTDVENMYIRAVDGEQWLDLRLSSNSNREQQFTHSRTQSLRHICGADYPVLEQSRYRDTAGSYDAAFATAEEARAFEALRGRVVIVKSRGGNVLVGVMSSLQKTVTDFYHSFIFTVQRIHWRGVADDEDG